MNQHNTKQEFFSESDINHYLRPSAVHPCVILIEGTRGTFKATLARDFLLNDLIRGESVLYISLRDRVKFDPRRNLRISEKFSVSLLWENLKSKDFRDTLDAKGINASTILDIINKEGLNSENYLEILKTKNNTSAEALELMMKESIEYFWGRFDDDSSKDYSNNSRREIKRWKYKSSESYFIEIAFKSGYILAEEFIKIFLEVLMGNEKINRIVIDDLSSIGVSYPFLFSSKTASDLFLTTFVHIIRNRGKSLVMTGTTGNYEKSDRVVERAKTLADTVLTHKQQNVFGDRYITLMGDGLTHHVGSEDFIVDLVPAVIKPIENNLFKIDTEILKGLVGFDTGVIHRPGLTLYLFEDTHTHNEYNNELETLLESAFTFNDYEPSKPDKKLVNIISYNPSESAAFHSGLGLLKENPIPQTVLCTVDEFYLNFEKVFIPVQKLIDKDKRAIANIDIQKLKESEGVKDLYVLPYYHNVLLLAYDIDFFSDGVPSSWDGILRKVGEDSEEFNDLVYFKKGPSETLSCLLIDALIAGLSQKNINGFKKEQVLEAICGSLGTSTDVKSIDLAAKELFALRKLLRFSSNAESWIKGNSVNSIESDEMLSRAKLFVCWYSELRDILSVNPELASKIGFCALPGKGFKGDFHIGILEGSVNYSLGLRVLDKLCSEQEDYKRFIKGIGIPSKLRFNAKPDNGKQSFSQSFKAWPNASKEFTMQELYKIHDEASSRKEISNYQQINQALAVLFLELIRIDKDNDSEIMASINADILDKIPIILDKFKPFSGKG